MKNKWVLAGGTVIGKGHIAHNLPCQDSHGYEIYDKFGIAVVCDGAGTAKYADKGSAETVRLVLERLPLVLAEHFPDFPNQMPEEEVWRSAAIEFINDLLDSLSSTAKQLGCELRDLNCTLMLNVFSDNGCLHLHVGDGRGTYLDESGNWQALFTPYRGQYANETVFVTTLGILDPEDRPAYMESGVLNFSPDAFALLTDGMEPYSFECNVMDEDTGHYEDPNRPFPGFFNPVLSTLRKIHTNNPESLQEKWTSFLDGGTPPIANEPDDKTMIVGFKA